MTNTIWGGLFVVFGVAVTAQGWVLFRDPEGASERMQNGRGARFQPRWAVRSWTPGNMRARAVSMFVGGPAFVVVGVLALTGVVDLG